MTDLRKVNKKQLALLLGVSEPTIAKWVDEGMPCTDRGGKGRPAEFDAPACIVWWKESKLLAAAAKPAKLHEREQLADIETKELKLRQLQSSVVDRAAMVDVFRNVMLQHANLLRQSPRRWAHKLIGLPDEAAAVECQTEIVEAIIADLRLPETWQSVHEPTQIELTSAA